MSFSSDIQSFAKNAERAALKIFRGTALDLFGRIVKRTPVGNPSIWKNQKRPDGYVGGSLRANWQVGINRQATGTVGPNKNIGSVISRESSSIKKAKGGDSIYITNNLPYAQAVEHGHSKQAPQGMVKVTVAEFKGVVAARGRKA